MKTECNVKIGSKTYHYRKVTKPLLERKRRARINKCLDDLKELMIECIRQQGDNIARLEKADILELTVEHLRKIKRDKLIQINNSSVDNNIDSFKSGYVHAANEVSRALALLPRVDIKLGTQLMTRLGHRLNQIQQQEQTQQYETIMPNRITNSSSSQLEDVTPLSIYCGSACDNYYQSDTMLSPSSSSGYGSDNEISTSLSSSNQYLEVQNIWRPW